MPERLVSPGPGRDDAPRREEDWLAWCEALEASGQALDPDDEELDDAAPWDADLDALIAECREITAEEAAFAARAAARGAARRDADLGGTARPRSARVGGAAAG
jgi:hypothetical protein